jgi:hypothetical protein
MPTRCFVGVMKGDKCEAVYVHHDGYLAGVGADLLMLKTQEEVEELISHGDRSTLGGNYYSERGEDWSDVKPKVYDTFDEFFEACDGSWGEYYYIFKDGVWYYGQTSTSSPAYRKLIDFAKLFVS